MEIQQQYSLQDFRTIISNGFQFELPDVTLKLINELSNEVGSPTYVKTPIFQKKEMLLSSTLSKGDNIQSVNNFTKGTLNYSENNSSYRKRKGGGKNMEMVNNEDWETIRTFHATKMEQKTGNDAQFDVIRSYLNKLTDKNMEDMTSRIINIVEEMKKNEPLENILTILYNQIFENAFSNRFYSKNYGLLYSKLLKMYDLPTIEKKQLDDLLNKIQTSIGSIEFVESSIDYDKFCKINKDNEKRKAMCEFLINLIKQEIVEKEVAVQLLNQLFNSLFEFIPLNHKKNEVDEISELISILWKKDFYHVNIEHTHGFLKKITLLANAKTIQYLSLTNKCIFKFMDMIEM